MYLYNVTLQQPTCIQHVISGNFSNAKAKEFVVARERVLELFRVDAAKHLVSVSSHQVFGVVRAIAPFRLTGGSRDYVVVGSDSGRIAILEYKEEEGFVQVHLETFGRSGCRRIVPGQYLAVDPRGRAVMIAAVEKQKFVYILNRDSAARLTISSPLEAHKSRTLCFCTTGLDVGFENPIFACLEVDYGDYEQAIEDAGGDVEAAGEPEKVLTFYELDLGLNHVVRKWSEAVEASANLLVPVPGGADGPGGVLVCSEGRVTWKNQEHVDTDATLPLRKCEKGKEGGGGGSGEAVIIVSHALFQRRDTFFFMLQSEVGDLYKVDLDYEGDAVHALDVKYFDTVPVANSLSIMRPAYLFCAAENGNHMLLQFVKDGSDDEPAATFKPRPLTNLLVLDELENMSPVLGMHAADLQREATPQLYGLCGTGVSSSLRVLRHGLSVVEVATSTFPGTPCNTWTVKKHADDEYDSYIVVSFVNATLVLSIGATVEEVPESENQFQTDMQTLNVCQIGVDGLLQVLSTGVRHIRSDGRQHEWRAPGQKRIVHAAANPHQVVVALTGGELYYFQLDATGQLVEFARKDMGYEVACLDVAPLEAGSMQARFLAVGGTDNSVRILSLFPDDCLQSLAIQTLPSLPTAICIVQMEDDSGDEVLLLNIGMDDGVLLRVVLDGITGELYDVRRRFLGVRPVRLLKVAIAGKPSMLALSSRTWLLYNHQQRLILAPLSYVSGQNQILPPLDYCSRFASEQCPEGFVAITGDTLRIVALEHLSAQLFNQQEVPLKYTPRRLIVHPTTGLVVTLESDHRARPLPGHYRIAAPAEGEDKTEDETAAGSAQSVQQRTVSNRAPATHWASCIRLFDPAACATADLIELDDDEAAVCGCVCTFQSRLEDNLLVVGTTTKMQLQPRRMASAALRVYHVTVRPDGSHYLHLLHKTELDDVPTAMAAFHGRLLVGVASSLRLYELGKKKLLRKCELKNLPSAMKEIHVQGDRIVAANVREAFFYLKYRREENQLYIFAESVSPHWVMGSSLLDYDSAAGGDKFGNLFITRIPKELSEEIEHDPTAGSLQIRGDTKASTHKLTEVVRFHVGEMVTSVVKAALVPGGADILIYSTIHGAVGALVPFISREDVDFFSHLEMHMRQSVKSLLGRDHQAYRSAYFPVKSVIDGDLCEMFARLPLDTRESIAAELDRSPYEVMKKLEDLRNRCL
mmetsp:Transcript_7770/g.32717  ORF Transcript_7770/g.32717 Transcript_7770/m.32717 type:complete len:1204 (-) Transcript_7770:61-3672(-)